MKLRSGLLERGLLFLIALALTACPDSPGIGRCQNDEDCPQGFRCDAEDKVCRAEQQIADTGTAESGIDAARADVNPQDSRQPDAGAPDAETMDTHGPDTGELDTGGPDVGRLDAGGPDAVAADVGSFDSGDGFPAPWWDEDWPHRLRLRLHNAESQEELVRLPILIKLQPGHVVYDLALPDGTDLRFVDSEGTELPHEVERWGIGLTSTIWVTAPSAAAGSADSAIYLYLGNQDPPLRAAVSAWPAEYQLVVLFKGDTAAQAFVDSSPARHDIVGGNYIRQSGVHGNAAELGVDAHLEVATLSGIDFPQDQGSFSFWAWSSSWSSLAAGLLDDDPDDLRPHLAVAVRASAVLATPLDNTIVFEETEAQTPAPNSGWSRFAVVWDRTASPASLHLFRTNTLRDSISLPASWQPSGQRFTIAGTTDDSAALYVDDLRLARTARSKAWFKAGWLVDKDFFVIFEETPTPPEPERGVAGSEVAPLVLYEFDETFGTTVHDSSENGAPLDLEIADPDAVEWLGGALRVRRATVIESTATADKIVNLCPQLDALTVEAWVQPDSVLHRGPARIVSLSADTINADFMLGQVLYPVMRDHARFAFRVLTSATDEVGRLISGADRLTALSADADAERPAPRRQQVVFTWNGAEVCSYVDGSLSSEGCQPWGGSMEGLWTDERLTLVNEIDSRTGQYGRPWLGTLYRIAIYCTALTEVQVQSHYETGSIP